MKAACFSCPYRKDVPSGVWAEEEYDKLPLYDELTPLQPFVPFACHASPEAFCHGWAVCHTSRGNEYDLIALRLVGCPPIPKPSTPLFSSGAEAAAHGKKDLESPGAYAKTTQERLIKRYGRLKRG